MERHLKVLSQGIVSKEHFSMDGRLLDSTTDPEARPARKGKGKEAKLFSAGDLLTENRNGLVVDAHVSPVTGTCENETALEMLQRLHRRCPRLSVGADKGDDTGTFVNSCGRLRITPHTWPKSAKARPSMDAQLATEATTSDFGNGSRKSSGK